MPDSTEILGSIEVEDLEKRRYATIKHKGAWSKIDTTYGKLLTYIEENNLIITGNATEVFYKRNVHLGKGHGTIVNIYIPIK